MCTTIDDQLWRQQIKEYLFQLDAVRNYIQSELDIQLPGLIEFQDRLHNGVYLAALVVALVKNRKDFINLVIYDYTQRIYDIRGIQYRHIDNILIFLKYLEDVGLPKIFHPDVADIFEKKNIPRVIYCVRALMNYLNNSVCMKRNCTFSEELIAAIGTQLQGQDLSLLPIISDNKEDSEDKIDSDIEILNSVLLEKNYESFCEVLKVIESNDHRLSIQIEAYPLYFEELLMAQDSKKDQLITEEVKDIIEKQTKIFLITVFALKNNIPALMSVLKDVIKEDIVYCNSRSYIKAFREALNLKISNNIFNYSLTLADVVDIILEVNNRALEQIIRNTRGIAATKIQIWWKCILRSRHTRKETDVEDKLKYVVKLQAAWRGAIVRKYLQDLRSAPCFRVLKIFSSIIQYSLKPYEKELELQLYKSEIMKQIQFGKSIMAVLEEKDLQIGLLIQNRLNIQQIIRHPKQKVQRDLFLDEKKLKALDPESQSTLKSFQQLFYALQTSPHYFAFLLVNAKHSSRILQEIILSVFNYGSTNREEYLLLKVFEVSVTNEVMKYERLQDLEAANSGVMKTFINYGKQGLKMKCLKDILGTSICNILNEKDELLLYPMDIYKDMEHLFVNKYKNFRPPSTNNEALCLQPVKRQLQINILKMETYIKAIINKLTETVNLFPYGIKYFYKYFFLTMKEKFNVLPKFYLKIIGHSLFHNFVNPMLISPEMYGIVNFSAENRISSKQRKNLATVAKMLQSIVLNKGFSDTTKYLMHLNNFILDINSVIQRYILDLFDCQGLEEQFKVSQYSEAILIGKPQITINLQVLARIHGFLLEYQSLLLSDDSDPLFEILDEIGPHLSAELLLKSKLFTSLGIRTTDQHFRMFCITKFENRIGESTEIHQLFVSAKELCVYLLPYMNGRTLTQSLLSEPTKEESEDFEKHMEYLLNVNCNRPHPLHLRIIDKDISLSQVKRRLKNMLAKLELKGYASREDGYQAILTAIARDLLQRNYFRKIQEKEYNDVCEVMSALNNQNAQLETQLNVYEEYLESCLRSQAVGYNALQRKPPGKFPYKVKSKKSVKYTAQRLVEKEVLLSIPDVPEVCLPNITIEIYPEEKSGYFTFKGKFINLPMEKMSVDIRHLLHLQYEEIKEFTIFQNVRLNVARLILLINRKFYGNTEDLYAH